MQYYELTATVILTRDIHYTDAGEVIGQTINKTMLQDSELIELHSKSDFKHYVFNSFYPVEKDGVYREGRIYIYKIRSLNQDFIKKMKELLPNTKADIYKVVAVQRKTINRPQISNIYTLTPVVVTREDGKNWVSDDGVGFLKQRLQANLEKKYKAFYNEEVCPLKDIFTGIEVLNRKPIAINFKGSKFLGSKLKLWFNKDSDSQKLAFVAMACGLGEKNTSVGAGFCS
ncbi:MAG: CRISPR-associated endoribonuclease Cas6 [Clostridia bacterium]|nr:CRISPR-associated endoribonuclease Cas6 [Clostridia bacterium]